MEVCQKVNTDSDELGDQRLTSFHEEVGVIQKIVVIIKPRGERNMYVHAISTYRHVVTSLSNTDRWCNVITQRDERAGMKSEARSCQWPGTRGGKRGKAIPR